MNVWYDQHKDLDGLLRILQSHGVSPLYHTGFRWDWSEEALKSLGAEVVFRSQKVLDDIAALKPGQHTLANTLWALNDNDRIVDLWSTNVSFLGHVAVSKSIRDVATDISKKLSEFEVACGMRVDVFESLKTFAASAEGKALTGEDARMLEYTLRDFRRNGLHLPADKRARVEQIKKRMSTLGIEFSKNLGEENSTFEFSREELKGVPDDQLARFPKGKNDPNKYIVSLKYPDYFPVMELCEVESTRALLELHFNQRCMKENVPMLEELVRLRSEQADILGYPNHAAYVLETRMAKAPEKVETFLEGLSKRLTPLMNDELEYWKELKVEELKKQGEEVKKEDVKIMPYDYR